MSPYSVGSQWAFEPGSFLDCFQQVVEGVANFGVRSASLGCTLIYVNVLRPIAGTIGIDLTEGKRPKVKNGTLKVAAVGFGRTGTVREWLNYIMNHRGLIIVLPSI